MSLLFRFHRVDFSIHAPASINRSPNKVTVFDWKRTIATINLGKWMWSAVWFHKNNRCSFGKPFTLQRALKAYYLVASSVDTIYILDFEVKSLEEGDFNVTLVMRWRSEPFNWPNHCRLSHSFYVPELNIVIYSKYRSTQIVILKVDILGSTLYPLMQMVSTKINSIIGLTGFCHSYTKDVMVFCLGTDGKIERLILKEGGLVERFESQFTSEES